MAIGESTKGKGFGNSAKSQANTPQNGESLGTQSANQAKAIAQQTAQGLEQYLGHHGIDVLNQVRGAKHQITDAVSSAIAAELVPARIQAEVLTATVGKLQTLDPSTIQGFEWGYVPELQQPAVLPVVDISHLFPSSTQRTANLIQSGQPTNQEMAEALDGTSNSK